MKNISILVPERARLSSIEIPRHAFTEVNEILSAEGNPPLFNVQMVGLTKVIHLNEGLYSVKTDALLNDIEKTDLIKYFLFLLK